MIKVLIVDDQKILAEGLRAILETEDTIQVTDIAENGIAALAAIEAEEPQVVLMDIRMEKMDGVACTKMIKKRWPQIQVLILTTFDDREYITEAIASGASGYLLKDISGNKLIQAVKDVYEGEILLQGKVAAKLADCIKYGKNKEIDPETMLKQQLSLSDREAQIAIMISQGFTNKQIASALYITDGTVKNYVSNIYAKLEVSDRVGAAVKLRNLLEASLLR